MYLSWAANGSGVIGTYTSTARSGRLTSGIYIGVGYCFKSWARTRKEDGWVGIWSGLDWRGLCIYFCEGKWEGRMLAGPSSSHVKIDGNQTNRNK
jgi:hypothetical protein